MNENTGTGSRKNVDEEYPNAAILVAFSGCVKSEDTREKELAEQRNELIQQMAALNSATERERKRVEALEKARRTKHTARDK